MAATFVGGLIGGLLVGGLGDIGVSPTGAAQAGVVGAFVGGVAGAVAGLWQSRLIPNFQHGPRWTAWNTANWGWIWAVGYVIGWSINGMAGVATASAFILLASGGALSVLLYLTPDLEF